MHAFYVMKFIYSQSKGLLPSCSCCLLALRLPQQRGGVLRAFPVWKLTAGGLVSKSKSTHDKPLRYRSSVPYLSCAICLLTGCAHVSQFVAICLLESILLFFILFTCKFCPVSESVAICLSRINIFVTSSPAKQSSCHHWEKTLCNHSWSPPK